MILPKLNSTIPVAHLNIRGTAILVAFPDGCTPEKFSAIQAAALREGFRGEITAVWEDAEGRTRFIAPPQQHPFFQLVNYGQLRAQANDSIEFRI